MSKIKTTTWRFCPQDSLGYVILKVLWSIGHGKILAQDENISYVHCHF